MAPRSRPLIEVRKPPVDAVFALHLPQVTGKCRWCGKPTDEPGRKVWHTACEIEFKIIIMPDVARRALEQRDHGICCDCGADWSERYKFRKGPEYWSAGAKVTEVIWISLWHNDHKVPLWKVRGMDPLKRLEYFKLANMVTRCERCHALKTSDEAGEKAKYDRRDPAIARKAKPSRSWPKRSMRGPERRPAKDINDP